MAVANYGLVHWCARRVERSYPREDFDDLMSRGMFGLFRAVRGFNPSLGFKFSTYAVTAINNAMMKDIKARQTQSRGRGTVDLSLNQAADDDESLIDYLMASDDPAGEAAGSSFVAWAIGALPERCKAVVPVLIGERTNGEVAREMGVSTALVGQLCKQAIESLRRTLERSG